MKNADTVRAWKDEDYRLGLSAEELADVPNSPAGAIELADLDLEDVAGGKTELMWSLGCCPGFTRGTCACSIWQGCSTVDFSECY